MTRQYKIGQTREPGNPECEEKEEIEEIPACVGSGRVLK